MDIDHAFKLAAAAVCWLVSREAKGSPHQVALDAALVDEIDHAVVFAASAVRRLAAWKAKGAPNNVALDAEFRMGWRHLGRFALGAVRGRLGVGQAVESSINLAV